MTLNCGRQGRLVGCSSPLCAMQGPRRPCLKRNLFNRLGDDLREGDGHVVKDMVLSGRVIARCNVGRQSRPQKDIGDDFGSGSEEHGPLSRNQPKSSMKQRTQLLFDGFELGEGGRETSEPFRPFSQRGRRLHKGLQDLYGPGHLCPQGLQFRAHQKGSQRMVLLATGQTGSYVCTRMGERLTDCLHHLLPTMCLQEGLVSSMGV